MATSSDLWGNHAGQVNITLYHTKEEERRYGDGRGRSITIRRQIGFNCSNRITAPAVVLALLVPAMKISIETRLAIVNIVINEEINIPYGNLLSYSRMYFLVYVLVQLGKERIDPVIT